MKKPDFWTLDALRDDRDNGGIMEKINEGRNLENYEEQKRQAQEMVDEAVDNRPDFGDPVHNDYDREPVNEWVNELRSKIKAKFPNIDLVLKESVDSAFGGAVGHYHASDGVSEKLLDEDFILRDIIELKSPADKKED